MTGALDSLYGRGMRIALATIIIALALAPAAHARTLTDTDQQLGLRLVLHAFTFGSGYAKGHTGYETAITTRCVRRSGLCPWTLRLVALDDRSTLYRQHGTARMRRGRVVRLTVPMLRRGLS